MSERFSAAGKNIHERGEKQWQIRDSSFRDYLDDFHRPRTASLVSQVEFGLLTRSRSVVVDLLSSTHALWDIKSRYSGNNLLKGLAVGMHDPRADDEVQLHKDHGIEQVQMDLSDSKTLDEVTRWLGNDKAHLVMERGFGGLKYVPTNLSYQGDVVGRIWDMLYPNGGIAMLQGHPLPELKENGIPIEQWIAALAKQGVPHAFIPAYKSRDAYLPYSILILQKTSQAKRLPILRSPATNT